MQCIIAREHKTYFIFYTILNMDAKLIRLFSYLVDISITLCTTIDYLWIDINLDWNMSDIGFMWGKQS